jgi:hypothetical protein
MGALLLYKITPLLITRALETGIMSGMTFSTNST